MMYCKTCGRALGRDSFGRYIHLDRSSHVPIPVAGKGIGGPIRDTVSRGRERPSGAAALFTKGGGR